MWGWWGTAMEWTPRASRRCFTVSVLSLEARCSPGRVSSTSSCRPRPRSRETHTASHARTFSCHFVAQTDGSCCKWEDTLVESTSRMATKIQTCPRTHISRISAVWHSWVTSLPKISKVWSPEVTYASCEALRWALLAESLRWAARGHDFLRTFAAQVHGVDLPKAQTAQMQQVQIRSVMFQSCFSHAKTCEIMLTCWDWQSIHSRLCKEAWQHDATSSNVKHDAMCSRSQVPSSSKFHRFPQFQVLRASSVWRWPRLQRCSQVAWPRQACER